MALIGFLSQWSGAWLLATAAGRCSRSRRWRVRWRRAARGVLPAALLGGCAAALCIAAGAATQRPGPAALALWSAGAVAALGFATLWTAGGLEARGRRRSAAPLAWLGGLLAMVGCLATVASGSPGGAAPSGTGGLWLLVGCAGLLAGLSRKPRPTGTWAAVAYVVLALATAWPA